MESTKPAELYDAYYYAHGLGSVYQREKHWLVFFGTIADRIISDIAPQTVLDAGCAMGFLVESLRDRNVTAFGIDISEYAIQNVRSDIQPYCQVGSITEPFSQRYDLITCIEVLEHLPKTESEQAIKNLCQHTDDILFSSTPFDYKEATHFNVQPPEYWGEQFAKQGFCRDVDFDASFVLPWAVRFRRKQEPTPRLVREYERKFWLLSKENSDQRSLILEMRRDLAQVPDNYADLQADLEWIKTQIHRLRRQNWLDRLQHGLNRLNYWGVVGKRPAQRSPSLIQPLKQTFVAEYDNLCSLTVLIQQTSDLPLTQPLQVTLTSVDKPDDPPLVKRAVSPRYLPTMGPFTLRFSPIAGSRQQTYQITFHIPTALFGETAYLWSYLRPGRQNSQLLWGEQRLRGELVMTAAYGSLETSFADQWEPPSWLPRSFFTLDALLDLVFAVLFRKQG